MERVAFEGRHAEAGEAAAGGGAGDGASGGPDDGTGGRALLLVSVRSAAEARAAVAGGADIIDVKDPSQGPLGMAATATMHDVARVVAARRPVSLALGELTAWMVLSDEQVLAVKCAWPVETAFVKVGLAGAAALDWQAGLARLRQLFSHEENQTRREPHNTPARAQDDRTRRADDDRTDRTADGETDAGAGSEGADRLAGRWRGVLVPVVYWDWEKAGSPSAAAVLQWTAAQGLEHLLIDTADKAGPGLLADSCDAHVILNFLADAMAAGVRMALAGKLGGGRLRQAAGMGAWVVGVRSAACQGYDRQAQVTQAAVTRVRRMMREGVLQRSASDGGGGGLTDAHQGGQ